MQRRRSTVLVVGLALAVSGAACSATPTPTSPPAAQTAPPAAGVTPFATAAPMAETIDWANQLENFEAARFSDPTRVDNTWFPLIPGTQYVYEGFSEDAGKRLPHRIPASAVR